jgi:CHAT domain-containing protein
VFDKHDSRVRLNSLRGDGAGPGKDQRALETRIGFAESPARFADTLARSAADAGVHPGQRGQLFLPRLPFTRVEAKAVLGMVPPGSSRGALGFDASRSLAISGELGQYRIVHFATHALVDNIHPELSGLVLSLVDHTGQPVDGFLDLEDIYNLDLSADLVVLSACDTALGKELRGEGMIGLTRGFMYAGAPRVMATLWKVNDFATAKLMSYFYRGMERDGLKPGQALRQAQLAMLKRHSSSAPYDWAGFVLQGDWE